MKRPLLALFITALVALAFCAPAFATKYSFSIENVSHEPVMVRTTGIECTIGANHAAHLTFGSYQWLDVETDQSGNCAVLHRPSVFEIEVRDAEHRWVLESCEKWPLAAWKCHTKDRNGLKLMYETHPSYIRIIVARR